MASSPKPNTSSPVTKANSPTIPSSSPVTKANSPTTPSSSKPSSSSSTGALIPSLGHVFLPSHADILEIGKILSKGKAPEWNDKVLELDIYSDTPDALLRNKFPTIKLKNTFLVWTHRVSKGSGFDRTVKSPVGGLWKASGGLFPILDDDKIVVGYFRILKFQEGGRDGDWTDWWMKEFFVSEKPGNDDHVICTLVFRDLDMKENLVAFEKASVALTNKALAPRGTKLETTASVAKGSVKGKGSLVCDGSIDVGTEIPSFPRRTRSQKPAKASGSGGNDGSVILEYEGASTIGMATRSQAKKTGTGGKLKSHDPMTTRSKTIDVGTEIPSFPRRARSQKPAKASGSGSTGAVGQSNLKLMKGQKMGNDGSVILEYEGASTIGMATRSQAKKTGTSGNVNNTLKSHDAMTTRSKRRVGTGGTVKASTRDASTPTIPVPVQPQVEPIPVVQVLPVQAPVVAPHVETGAVAALGRKVGLSVAQLDNMSDEDYYNLDEEQ